MKPAGCGKSFPASRYSSDLTKPLIVWCRCCCCCCCWRLTGCAGLWGLGLRSKSWLWHMCRVSTEADFLPRDCQAAGRCMLA